MAGINEGRPQLSDEIASLLRDRIMSGVLRPGERIRLEEVAEEAGLSITPVREALLMLRAEDVVELQPRRGYVVAPLSRQDVIDVFALQGDIAGELAARVAAIVTTDQVDELVAAHQRLREEDLFKKPGVAETIDWAKCLVALDAMQLSPQVIADTLGALLKYQDDIAKLQGSEAKRILDEARAELGPA